ncbi:MAG: HNH endonuclease, partial [Acidimicrobiia bacterium]|nr:HNH endonuclease [Acidimicrobiia bacterium]
TRQVHHGDGCRTMVEWVSSRADLSAHTAKRLVAVTKRLVDRPDLLGALAAGEVSFERVEQVARTTHTIDDVAHLDIASVTRLAAKQTRLTRHHERDAHDARFLTMQPNLDQSMWKVWGQLAGLDGAIVQDALFARADTFPTESHQESRGARNADALTAIAQDSLTTTNPNTSASSVADLVVFVDTRHNQTTNGYVPAGPIVGAATIDELLCGGAAVDYVTMTSDGQTLNVGHKSPKIPRRLRRAVLGRDDGCCVDGCTSRYRLQAHHIIHWADGGPTNANNLVTLCWFHHHVVIHQRGFTINPDSPRTRLRLQRPNRAPPK